ncbi:MAG: tetratricopeptide repeat protein [Deltaproteobacteria bacterium]|nr:tetratricopeptide repeat protein [Deltaproteobacteria bacterium]MBK8238245.1 tetratricopeptide repeat protein [Deltaproteobacteria bacterium]MBP7290600.1 tetratricopeptide repeat protein [Nannocystaceae bacterium]
MSGTLERWCAGLAGLWVGGCLAAMAAAAPPAGGGTGTLPPPPSSDTDGDTEGERPEDVAARRQEEFEGHLQRAQAAITRERHDEAIREYTAALRLQPGDPTALLGRANARKARTAPDRCPTQAIGDLRLLESYDPRGAWLEQRATLVGWMAACGPTYAADRLLLAKEIAAEKPGAPGRASDIRVLVAQLLIEGVGDDDPRSDPSAARAAALLELERYRGECEKLHSPPTAAALRLQADIYNDSGEPERAVPIYKQLVEQHPDSSATTGVTKILRDLEMQRELKRLDATQGIRPNDEALEAYGRGLQLLRAGDLDAAQAEFEAAVQATQWFPRAHYALGVTHARKAEFGLAVEALQRAIHMAPTDHQAHMTLGLLYKKEFGGAEDQLAIKHLAAALRLRPDLSQLHLLLGELYARTDREKAREHYERFLRASAVDDPDAAKARRALEDLEREIRQEEPAAIPPPAEESLRSVSPDLQRMINEAYLRSTEYQDLAYAEKILLEAKDRFPTEPVVYNQLAHMAFAQDRTGDARQYWEQSLALQEDQVEVHERLGLLLRSQLPDEAIAHLQRAADLGSLTARYVLAELLWAQPSPWRASAELDRYLAVAGDYDLDYERALALRETIDRRLLQFYLVAGAALFALLSWPTWRIYRRLRGKSLRQLLERDPKSFPEVARILSLIRHEILKHNTAFLGDVGRALEHDAPDAEARAAVLAQRMFGDQIPGRVGAREPARLPGIYGRFLGYVEELDKVGRAHRVTLNLQRKDPIFGPMIRAFDELAARAGELRAVHGLRSGRRLELAKVLRRSAQVLGRQAFERLSGLIRELCIVNVDARFIEATYAQVAGEAQFASSSLAPLQCAGLGAPVRIFRTDLEDILANVIRNSLRSSLSYAQPPVGLGVELITELDEITGLGTLAIRIKDRSFEQLSNEMLRGRYVERGMGITVDLLSRYDGSIAVEPEPGWNKAVVVRFFMLEDDGTSVATVAA